MSDQSERAGGVASIVDVQVEGWKAASELGDREKARKFIGVVKAAAERMVERKDFGNKD